MNGLAPLRLLAVLPLAWGSMGAVITEQSGISVGLFIAGIVGTIVLVRGAYTERNNIRNELKSLRDEVKGLDERLDALERNVTE